MTLGDRIENTKQAYKTEEALTQSRDQAFGEAINYSKTLQAVLAEQRSGFEQQATALQNLFASLAVEIQTARRDVENAQDKFNNTVLAATEARRKCNLGQILAMVSAIVAIATGVETVFAAVSTAVGQLAEGGLSLDNVKTITKTLKPAGASFSEIVAQWGQIKDQIAKNPDSARLVINVEDYETLVAKVDEQIKKVDASDEAKAEFKNIIHHYIDLVRARNTKILEHDSLVVSAAKLSGQIAERQLEQQSLAEQRSANSNPEVSRYTAYMDDMARNFREQLRLVMWQEVRALELWSLENKERAFPLDASTSGALAGSQSTIELSIAQMSGDLPGDSQTTDFSFVVNLTQRNALDYNKDR
jgi:hypothetical protein